MLKNSLLKFLVLTLLFGWTLPVQAADETLWCLTSSNTCKTVTNFSECENTDMQVKGKEICEGFLSAPLWCLDDKAKCVTKLDLCASGINDMTYQACKSSIPEVPVLPKPVEVKPKEVGDNFSTKGNSVFLINPIGGTAEKPQGEMNLSLLLGKIIKNTLGILGTGALLVFVYAGFQWVTAGGNSDKISAGAEAMTWSAIGICIIFSSYAILQLVFETLLGDTALKDTPANQEVVGKACYCTINGQANKPLTEQAYGLSQEAACLAVKGKKITTKAGDTLENCTWK